MKRTKLKWQGEKSGRAIGVEFEKLGNWTNTYTKLALLDKNIKKSLDYGEKKVADLIVKLAKGHLRNQDLGWDALADSTVWKKKGNTQILIDTGTYLNNIKTWKAGGVRLAGVPFGVINPVNGEEVWRIAQIHEFKSLNGGPSRALWNPVMEEIGGPAGVKQIIFGVLYKKLLALGYPVKKEF